MNKKTLTWVVIITTTVLVIAYDIFAAVTNYESTVSVVMLNAAHRHPVIPFAFGVLMGHLFWSQPEEAAWRSQKGQRPD